MSSFLDEAIHARIGIRLIAEQHLSLAASYFRAEPRPTSPAPPSTFSSHYDGDAGIPSPGTIHTDLSPYAVLRHVGAVVTDLCQSTLGVAPRLLIEGHKSATYVGVPVHLEYVLTELLKNSFRASVERRDRLGGSEEDVRPVKVTIAKSKRHVSMRIRDRGGGIHPRDLDRVFSYAFTTAGRAPGADPGGASPSSGGSTSSASAPGSSSPSSSGSGSGSGSPTVDPATSGPYSLQAAPGGGASPHLDGLTALSASGLQSSLGTLAGLGFGLPMARIYATYFGQGAELGVVSLWGEGCDTFVRVPANPVG